MSYLIIRAKDPSGKVLYEKDVDAGIFHMVGIHMSSGLCLQGMLGQHENYSLLVTPHFTGEPEYQDPTTLTLSDEQKRQEYPQGMHLVVDPQACPPDAPVSYFAFTVVSAGRLHCRWDLRADKLRYLNRTIQDALINGGYLGAGQAVECEYVVRLEGGPQPGERILAQPLSGFEFKVTQRGIRREDLPSRRLADFPNRKLVGQPDTSEFPIILINELVLGQILVFARDGAARREEVAGLLVGEPYRDTEIERFLIDIRGIIPASGAPATSVSVRFTMQVLDQLNRIKDTHYPGVKKVGWYHSHPPAPDTKEGLDSSIFFSDADRRVHDQFRELWQVALVVEGLGRGVGFFRWTDERCERIVSCRGFYIYSIDEADSAERK